MLREGSRPIAAAQQGKITTCSIKLVRDFRAGCSVGCIGRCIKLRLYIHSSKVCIAIFGHTIGHGVSLGGQNVVDGFMGICRSGNIIVALVQNVGFCLVSVVAFQLLFLERCRDRFTCARLQQAGLRIANQFDRGLLYGVFFVVLSVGTLCIDLNNILARSTASVGYSDAYRASVSRPGRGEVFPFKSCQRQTITERILHSLLIVILAHVAVFHDSIFIAGLIIFITDIDAFGIVQIGVGGDIAVLIKVIVRAIVLCCRAAERIIGSSIYQMTTGVHVSSQNICYRIQAIGARQSGVQHGMNVLILFYPAGFHHAGAIDQNNNILEVFVKIVNDP